MLSDVTPVLSHEARLPPPLLPELDCALGVDEEPHATAASAAAESTAMYRAARFVCIAIAPESRRLPDVRILAVF
jgi:hypothetical protein